MKNIHLHFGFFALLLGAANMMSSVGGNLGTAGIFANVLSFDPTKLVAQESSSFMPGAPIFFDTTPALTSTPTPAPTPSPAPVPMAGPLFSPTMNPLGIPGFSLSPSPTSSPTPNVSPDLTPAGFTNATSAVPGLIPIAPSPSPLLSPNFSPDLTPAVLPTPTMTPAQRAAAERAAAADRAAAQDRANSAPTTVQLAVPQDNQPLQNPEPVRPQQPAVEANVNQPAPSVDFKPEQNSCKDLRGQLIRAVFNNQEDTDGYKSLKKQFNAACSQPIVAFDAPVDDSDVKTTPFKDVEIATLEGKAANELYQRGVIGGTGNGNAEFKGDEVVNRAVAAKLLVNSCKSAKKKSNVKFKDVRQGDWFYNDVKEAAERGIIGGYRDGNYKPGNSVSRAEFVKMLSIACNIKENIQPENFADVNQDDWFAKYAGAVQAYDLFPEDNSDNTFEPAKVMTKAEVAEGIYQYLKNRDDYVAPADVEEVPEVSKDVQNKDIEKLAEALYSEHMGRKIKGNEVNAVVAKLDTDAEKAKFVANLDDSQDARVFRIGGMVQTFLGRAAQKADEDKYLQLLKAGSTEEDVIANILASAEYAVYVQKVTGEKASEDVLAQAAIAQLFGADAANDAVAKLSGGIKNRGFKLAITDLLNSDEYRAEVVKLLYQDLLEREPSQQELNNHVKADVPLEDVKVNLEVSAEFLDKL